MNLQSFPLLSSSNTYEDSNIMDRIRQSYINLKDYANNFNAKDNENDIIKNDIHKFLQEAQTFLENDIPINTTKELIYLILFCFSKYFQYSFPFLDLFFKKSKFNSNFIITIVLVFSGIFYTQPQAFTPEYTIFIQDSLKEILPQIQNIDEPWTLFQHKINPFFKKDLLVNLLVCTNLTKQLFFDFFPFILRHGIYSSNKRYKKLLQNFKNNNIFSIIPPSNASNLEIQEFIKNRNLDIIFKMSPESLILLTSAAIFVQSDGTQIMRGLNEYSIFQFFSIVEILLQEVNHTVQFDSQEYSDFLTKAANSLKKSDFEFLNESVTLVFNGHLASNKSFRLKYSEHSLDAVFILIKKFFDDEFALDKKSVYQMIIYLSNLDDSKIQCFFKKYQLFEFVFSHLSEINKYCTFVKDKFSMSVISQEEVTDFISKLKTPESFIETISFIINCCTNVPDLFSSSKEFNANLLSVFREKKKEKNIDDILLISTFVINYVPDLFSAVDLSLPNSVKFLLKGVYNQQISMDEIIDTILLSQHPEEDCDFMFSLLHKEMMKDKELRKGYLDFLVTINSEEESNVSDFFSNLVDPYNDYQDDLIESVNRHFYFNKEKNVLLRKLDYSLADIKAPELGKYVVDKLFTAIKKKPGNFQAFLCLKDIVCSFPFLFIQEFQKIIDAVLPSLDFISLLYESDTDYKDKISLIKTSICALSFLFSSLQAPLLLDKFMNWLFPNILSFTNGQVTCLMVILHSLYNDGLFHCVIPAYVIKYNCMGIVGNLLERKIENSSFRCFYRSSIYTFIKTVFFALSKLWYYEIVQIDNFKKMENSFNYMYDYIYLTSPFLLLLNDISEIAEFCEIYEFYQNIIQTRKYYIYEYNLNLTDNTYEVYQLDNFRSKLEKTFLSEKQFRPKVPEFSVKMVRYLVMQRGFVYCWLFYNMKTTIVAPLYEALSKAEEEINQLKKEKEKNPDDPENASIMTYSIDDYLSPCYSQQNLYDVILDQLLEPITLNIIYNTLFEICKKKTGLTFLLKAISRRLADFSRSDTFNESILALNSLSHLILILEYISSMDNFEPIFVETCCDDLLDFVLSPKIRKRMNILVKVGDIFTSFKNKLPDRVVYLFELIFISGEEKSFNLAMTLCSKFDKEQSKVIESLVMRGLDAELSKETLTPKLYHFLKLNKSIAKNREDKIYKIIEKVFSTLEGEEDEEINNKKMKAIAVLFNCLAPQREKPIKRSNSATNTIPENIREKNPQFWQLYEKHMDTIIASIENDPSLIENFSFLLDYPELVSFEVRSSYFRSKMNDKISENKIVFEIERENILESSFTELKFLNKNELINTIQIEFVNEPVQDFGGARREWFELLIKELFSQKNKLFECSKVSHNYQPSPRSSSFNSDYLEYFKFAGKVIGRSLAEGNCIDVHFTRSFYKQIVHEEPCFSDLEEVDCDLYRSLEWMLNNDVGQIEQFFAIEVIENDETRTIPLKEGGEDTRVTNENKKEYVDLYANFILKKQIEDQINSFCEGFEMLIGEDDIRIFTPDELDLLVSGNPTIDVDDMRENTVFEFPYTAETPVVKMFFEVISKWSNEDLSKLLKFITGSSKVPANGFREFCSMTHYPLTIESGGARTHLPQSRTCFNILLLPQYETEEEMNKKLHQAIEYCDYFGME